MWRILRSARQWFAMLVLLVASVVSLNISTSAMSAHRTFHSEWYVEDPVFISPADSSLWHHEWEMPFGGCRRFGATYCVYPQGYSYVYTFTSAYAPKSEWGHQACGLYHKAVRFQEHLSDCDPRTFIPLDVAEGGYFAHFMTNVLPKLALIPHSDLYNALVYLPPTAGVSRDTRVVADMLNLSITTSIPKTCFRKVIWACNAIGYHWSMANGIRTLLSVATLPDPHVRIYMKRNSGNKNGRGVRNERSVIRHYQDNGFTILDGETPLDKILPLLRRASVFISAHGGACAKIFFMPKDSVFIEIDTHKRKTSIYHLVARSLDIHYGFLHFTSGTINVDTVDALRHQIRKQKST